MLRVRSTRAGQCHRAPTNTGHPVPWGRCHLHEAAAPLPYTRARVRIVPGFRVSRALSPPLLPSAVVALFPTSSVRAGSVHAGQQPFRRTPMGSADGRYRAGRPSWPAQLCHVYIVSLEALPPRRFFNCWGRFRIWDLASHIKDIRWQGQHLLRTKFVALPPAPHPPSLLHPSLRIVQASLPYFFRNYFGTCFSVATRGHLYGPTLNSTQLRGCRPSV